MGETRRFPRGPALAFVVLGLMAAAHLAGTSLPTASGSVLPPWNPWLSGQKGLLNMAHQGGELEAPASTMYAFRTAVRDRGADSLEMDIYTTEDDRLVVLHDPTVDRTTNGSGAVKDMSLAEIQALDAAWWHSPGSGQYDHGLPAESYPLRGVRTGGAPPPAGFTADDFRIPTMDEVLDEFPDTPLNVDMKVTPGIDGQGESTRTATLLAEMLNRAEYRDRKVIVASFDQATLEHFHALAPEVDVSASLSSMLQVFSGNWAIAPHPVALQVPMVLGQLDPPMELRRMGAKDRNFAVHVWTEGRADEKDETYAHLRDQDVQGIFTMAPSRLHEYLCRAGERRPDGAPRCASQRMTYRIGLPSRALRKYLKKGLPVRVRCSQVCSVQLEVRMRRAATRRLKIKGKPRPVDRGLVLVGTQRRVKKPAKAGLNVLRASVFPQAKRRLARVRKARVELTVKVRDGAGWETGVVRRWVTLKAPRGKAGRG